MPGFSLRCGLDRRRIDRDAVDLREALGEALRQDMGLAEARPVMLQGVQGSGSNDPGLAEAAANLLLEPPGPGDELARSGQAGADRRAQGLGEADADAVERRRVGCLGDGHGGTGVPEAGAVEMKAQATRAADIRHGLKLVKRPDRPAADVVRVLQAQEFHGRRDGGWEEGMRGAQSSFDVLRRENSPHARQ